MIKKKVEIIHTQSMDQMVKELNKIMEKDHRYQLIQVDRYAAGACFTAWLVWEDE